MIKRLMESSRPYIPYAPFVAVAAVMIAVLAAALVRLAQPPQPPLHYLEAEYRPARPIYAPLETMQYTPTLQINSAGRVSVLRSFWDRGKNSAAVLCDGSSAPTIEIIRNFPAGIVGNVRGGRRVLVPIPNLPPGDYYLISSAVGPSGGQSVTEIPFSVVKRCGV